MPSFNAYINLLMTEAMNFLLEPINPVDKRALLRVMKNILQQAEAVLDAEEKRGKPCDPS